MLKLKKVVKNNKFHAKIKKLFPKSIKNKHNPPNKKTNFVCYIKNHFKLYASSTIKKSVPNALFLVSIRDMILRVFKKCKTKNSNAIIPSYKFLSKKYKFSKECATKKPNPRSFKFLTKRKISWNSKFDNPSENSGSKLLNRKRLF
jgi:hypothetical protein